MVDAVGTTETEVVVTEETILVVEDMMETKLVEDLAETTEVGEEAADLEIDGEDHQVFYTRYLCVYTGDLAVDLMTEATLQ